MPETGLGRVCLENSTCSHAEIEVADVFIFTDHPQSIDTRHSNPAADPLNLVDTRV